MYLYFITSTGLKFICTVFSTVLKLKRFACGMGLFQKVKTHKLCPNANFENGGTTI